MFPYDYDPIKARQYLIDILEDPLFPQKTLEKIAIAVYQSTNVAPFIYGYVLPVSVAVKGGVGFFYAIVNKVPNELRLMVSWDSYLDIVECAKALKEEVRCFPLYGLSKRNLVDKKRKQSDKKDEAQEEQEETENKGSEK